MFTDYDVIIVGSGPAGLAASIYTSRAGFSTLVLESKTMGGELMNRPLIENYPGFIDIAGTELADAMLKQTMATGTEFQMAEVLSIKDKPGFKTVKTSEGSFTAKGVILASGSHPRKLNVPGEEELFGKGVIYCATCDGPQIAERSVVVAGAGDSGITEALQLERLGCKITIVEFMPQPKASAILLGRANESPNIEIICNTEITEITGSDWVNGVKIKDRETGEEKTLDVGGILVRIGMVPNTEYVKDIIELSPAGQIPVDDCMQTPLAGIFAAGDIRFHSPAQITAAAGDGVCAAMSFGRYANTLD